MTPQRYNFNNLVWNNSFNGLTINITRTPTAIDLTELEDIELVMRQAADNRVVQRLSIGDGITVNSASQLVIDPATSVGLKAGKYTYTLDFIETSSIKKTYIYGTRNLINADGSY